MNILLTAIGSMSALCIIHKLHKAGCKVIGCDIYPKSWHYEASQCDVFAQAPYANTKEYIPFLLNLAIDNDVRYIFPLTDVEIDIINENRYVFKQAGIVICFSSRKTLSVVRNKLALYDFFKEDKKVLSIPTYTYKDDLSKLMFPCVAKPIKGRSSEGLHYLRNRVQLKAIESLTSYVFQPKIEGQICTVDFVRDVKSDSEFCVPREELLRTKNGAGITVRIFHNEKLEALVDYIGYKLNIQGVINMEFIVSSNNYYLLDINPRFSAGIAFSCNMGYDFIIAHLNCFRSEKIPSPIAFSERIETKYFMEN